MRQYKYVLLTSLLVSACNLASSVTSTPEIQVTPATNNPSTETVATDTLDTTSAGDTANCVPRAEWPEYTVVAGDFLSDIATRTGSTIDELVAANCLQDPDSLAVGQRLRVPRLPAGVPSSPLTMTYASTFGFAFDYPSGWYIQNIPGGPVTGISLSSFPYDLNSEPPEAGWTSDMVIIIFAYVPLALASSDLEAWYAEDKRQTVAGCCEIIREERITLSSGLSALRMLIVSGSGHSIDSLYTIINENNIAVSARGNANVYDPVIDTLRPA